MKILHTSDWHLGRSLYGRKRYDEFSAFLDWLAEFIQTESVDALLVAGDIFDTSMVPVRCITYTLRCYCKTVTKWFYSFFCRNNKIGTP